MFPRATALDEVGAISDAIEHTAIRIELLTQLIEVHQFDAGPSPHGPLIRCELAEQETEQRGLAGAVRPDQSHAVTARDSG
jgi:hypothetical protein